MLRFSLLLLFLSARLAVAADVADDGTTEATDETGTTDATTTTDGSGTTDGDDDLDSFGFASADSDDTDTLDTSAAVAASTVYDCYTGLPATKAQLAKYKSKKLISTCTVNIKACKKNERRRLDGTCNNLKHPVKGSFFSPVRRLLPSQYTNGRDPRKSIDGTDLKLPRSIRNALLSSGKESSLNWTQAVPAFAIWVFADTGDVHDIRNYLTNKTDCCTTGQKDFECTPNYIPEDDPVHRFSGVRCLNLTRPRVWNDVGCTDDPKPTPLEYATGVFDCSQIYNPINEGDKAVRSYEGGHLAVDVDENGIAWPPNGDGYCPANGPEDIRCFGHASTELLSSMMVSIWSIRHHNYIADKIAEVNPCWSDEQLFQTAKEVNTGFLLQIYIYELLKALIGSEYLIKKGVISKSAGFREVYDESTYPEISIEYLYGLRWFHMIQDISARMYSTDGTYLREFPYVNMSFRPGFLARDNNIVEFTPHLWRQPAGKSDYTVDPDLMERANARMQYTIDTMTSDLYKSRLLGFPPYIDYVQHCTGHNITTFEDLEQHMPMERIIQMKRVYNYVSDIDLMAGLWAENPVKGGDIPETLACIFADLLAKSVRADRHWYERAKRPGAFTKGQLAQIRKASMATFMCNVGDKVTEVQPQAFRLISEENPLTPCEELDHIDFSAWTDTSCYSDTDSA